MQDNEWLETISKFARAGTYVVPVAQLVWDLAHLGDATVAETFLELSFNTVAFSHDIPLLSRAFRRESRGGTANARMRAVWQMPKPTWRC